MGIREKEILYRMVFMKLYKTLPILPRGAGKYRAYLNYLMHLDEIALERTNYILDAIDESYERELFPS